MPFGVATTLHCFPERFEEKQGYFIIGQVAMKQHLRLLLNAPRETTKQLPMLNTNKPKQGY